MVPAKVTLFSPGILNAYSSILVTDAGMVMLVKTAPENAPFPILVSDEGEAKVTLSRYWHPNASCPIVLTDEGITILFIAEPPNADLPILVSDEGEAKVRLTMLLLPKNAFSSIEVTDAGISMPVSARQFLNTSFSIFVNDAGLRKVTLSKSVLRNAISPIVLTDAGITILFKPVLPELW